MGNWGSCCKKEKQQIRGHSIPLPLEKVKTKTKIKKYKRILLSPEPSTTPKIFQMITWKLHNITQHN